MEKLRKFIFVIALLVFLGSAGYLLVHFIQGQMAERDFRALKVEDGHDLDALYAQNPDIVGWVQIEDTHIDYPVMQTPSDPEFYLRRNFQKEYSVPGTPFVDAASDLETSKNWIIYGHNMKSGSMFHDTVKFEDPEFYEEHKIIHFDTRKDGEGLYEVVAAGRTKIYNVDDDVFKYYQYPLITDEATFNEYVAGVKAISAIDTGITPEYGDQLITLSTCEYHTDDGRFIVVARKVTPDRAAEQNEE